MQKILRELKLESSFAKFAAQRIEPENVSALSDEELSCLGVFTIGDLLRVCGLCANAGKHHPSVAANILSERMAPFSGRFKGLNSLQPETQYIILNPPDSFNCGNNLVPRVFHLPTPEGAREERPWFRLVTCLGNKFIFKGGVPIY